MIPDDTLPEPPAESKPRASGDDPVGDWFWVESAA